MVKSVQEYSVFVASPSDLAAERAVVLRAAAAANVTVGQPFDLRLAVLGWEQPQPSLGRPQAAINPVVQRCHIFIGVLNRRFGSPTGEHESGFAEEFDLAVERHHEPSPTTPEYGLAAYVYTTNLDRALRAVEGVEAGMVGVNTGIVSNSAAPFGGIKQSGIGREGGEEGIEEYLSIRYASIADPYRRPGPAPPAASSSGSADRTG